mgnify:CR=1 FL=1
MNFNRIYAIILRYLYAEPILNRIYKISYWNILNIVIWGTTSKWIQTQTNNPELGLIILTGLAFWQIVFRVNIETAKNLLDKGLSIREIAEITGLDISDIGKA